MKKRILILILLTIPSIVLSMDNKQKKEFPFSIEALDELTNKTIGCSEDLTDRKARYNREKDREIQEKIKNGGKNTKGKGVAGFLEVMHKKYHTADKPAWLNSIDPECKPFSTECNDVCDFVSDGKYKSAPLLWSYCSNLNKSTEPLSEKNQALLEYAHQAAAMEQEWLDWRSRKIEGGNRDGHRHAFERTIRIDFVKDESGNNKKQFNKKENMEENVIIPTIVHEHLNSPYYQRIEENPYEFDTINVANAWENESYHKELMFMQRQLLKMELFYASDKEKLERQLDDAWEKKEQTLNEAWQKITSKNEWTIFGLLQKIFWPKEYIQKKEICDAEYNQQHQNAEKNIANAKLAQKTLKQAIQSYTNKNNRFSITQSSMQHSIFDDLKKARERCSKE